MPRCARLLKLKLQGKAPFLGCNTSSVTFQNLVYETYERCCTILCPPVEAPMPPHAIGYPFVSLNSYVSLAMTVQGEPSARMAQQRQWL